VVDDDSALRAGIESLLRSAGLAVRCYASANEFAARPATEGLACLVLDVRLPGTSGLELQGQLAQREPGLPIVFISGHGDIPMTVRAIKAGAVEFLPKPFRDQDLLDAVQMALDRARVSRRSRLELLALQHRFDALTPRERQVLSRVASGALNKQIAFDLGISEVTVKIHRRQMMHKMEADSVADLVRMAERLGCYPPRC
jgi:FixJ family two-component response regulator